MRTFVFYSVKARTSGNIKDLKKAGRIDIVCHTIIHSFFLSHKIRKDIELHLCLDGPPNAPQHLIIKYEPGLEEVISKKDVSGLISRMLYKSSKHRKIRVFPGCYIEKKHFKEVIRKLKEEGKKICLLDIKGEQTEEINKKDINDAVFILGDDDGIPKKKLREIKSLIDSKLSLGPEVYFTSQSIIILNNLIDKNG